MLFTLGCLTLVIVCEVSYELWSPRKRKLRAIMKAQELERIFSGRNYWEVQR